jgi:ATP-dependent helicase HrpB
MLIQPLPIDPLLPEIVARLGEAGVLVLQAPPGAGKTTRVPPALLDAGLAGAGRVLVLQPRRLAARAAAARIAAERGVELGGEVGYQVRFESRISKATRLAVLTEGIFARMLADDPFLDGVGAVVFDEFHERSLYSDVTLAMAKRVRAEVRPDLKLLVMSATLDAEPVARFLDNAPLITSAGRAFPVEIAYLAEEPVGPLEQTVVDGVLRMIAENPSTSANSGDVLVFLPGVGEIRRVANELAPLLAEQSVAVDMLFGDMPLAEQQAVLRPGGQRRVVLATNVVETSLTIDGVTTVVDSGWARQLRSEPGLGINRLALERISRASAAQRAGRAGRTAPGRCLRLWTQRRQHGLSEHSTPEIRRVDLAGPALELMCWGEQDLARFPWFEAPTTAALEQAETLLRGLGAIDHQGPTPLGRAMARLPAQPRLARLLLAGRDQHAGRLAAIAAALLGERDPWLRDSSGGAPLAGRSRGRWSDSDVLDRVLALEAIADRGRSDNSLGRLDPAAARQTLRVADQLEKSLDDGARGRPRQQRSSARASSDEVAAEGLLRSLLAAFPDRVARRREPHSPRAVLVGGRGVRLDARSAVREAELFIAVELEEVGKSESLVRMASSIERDWLSSDELNSSTEVEFDPPRERVVAWRRVRWRDLLLEEAATSIPADIEPGDVLAAAAAERLDPRDWLEDDDRTLLARIACLRVWMPELNLPDWSDERLRELLPQLCIGLTSFAELRRRPLGPIVRQALSGQQLAALDREAPERIRVPSGSQIALQYVAGKPPVLAVRIQEIFGLANTPRVAGGRIPVLLHLLAPNMRPQQITDDLASFWDRTYVEVRKELRRRYPKHAWPDDPRAAQPERKPGGKRT